jgi:hypothetical protein
MRGDRNGRRVSLLSFKLWTAVGDATGVASMASERYPVEDTAMSETYTAIMVLLECVISAGFAEINVPNLRKTCGD